VLASPSPYRDGPGCRAGPASLPPPAHPRPIITKLYTVQGGSDNSGIFFFLLSNDTAQLKIIRFD
jgi:hypothetical protein